MQRRRMLFEIGVIFHATKWLCAASFLTASYNAFNKQSIGLILKFQWKRTIIVDEATIYFMQLLFRKRMIEISAIFHAPKWRSCLASFLTAYFIAFANLSIGLVLKFPWKLLTLMMLQSISCSYSLGEEIGVIFHSTKWLFVASFLTAFYNTVDKLKMVLMLKFQWKLTIIVDEVTIYFMQLRFRKRMFEIGVIFHSTKWLCVASFPTAFYNTVDKLKMVLMLKFQWKLTIIDEGTIYFMPFLFSTRMI